jgi:hypothetical protein
MTDNKDKSNIPTVRRPKDKFDSVGSLQDRLFAEAERKSKETDKPLHRLRELLKNLGRRP